MDRRDFFQVTAAAGLAATAPAWLRPRNRPRLRLSFSLSRRAGTGALCRNIALIRLELTVVTRERSN